MLVWGDIVVKVGGMVKSVFIVIELKGFIVYDCMFVNFVFVLLGGVVGK